jgi:hypothetical protein
MFGRRDPAPTPPPQPKAADVARIQGNGLVQLIISKLDPMAFHLFLNDTPVDQHDVESLLVTIDAGVGEYNTAETVRATLSRYVRTVAGQRDLQTTELFPGTFEMVALRRRIQIDCPVAGSLEGLYVQLGLKPDGTGTPLEGIQSLRILLAEGILDAQLTWTDGTSESLLGE